MRSLRIRMSLRTRLLAVLLVPVLGMTAFSTLWAVSRLEAARNADANCARTELVVNAARLLYDLDTARTILTAAAQNPDLRSSRQVEGFLQAQTFAAAERIRTRHDMLQSVKTRSAADLATLREVDIAIDALLRLADSETSNKVSVFSPRMAGAYSAAATRIERAVVELHDRADGTESSQIATLLGIVNLQRLLLREGAHTMLAGFVPTPDALNSMRDSMQTVSSAHELMSLQLPRDARVKLGEWRDSKVGQDWRKFQASVLTGKSVTLLGGLRPLAARDALTERLQSEYAARVTDGASATARSARRSFEIAVVLAVLLIALSVGGALAVLRPSIATLRRLERHALRIGQGELDVEPLNVSGTDETASLARSFERMSGTLRAVQQQIDALAEGKDPEGQAPAPLPGRIGESISRSMSRLGLMTSRLRSSEQLARLTVETAIEAIWILDANGRIVDCNPAAAELTECSAASARGLVLTDVVTLDGIELTFGDDSAELTDQDATLILESGAQIDLLVSTRTATGLNDASRSMVFARDISEHKRLQERLQFEATHDSLTGLPNRAALATAIDRTMVDQPDGFSLLFIDLDRFKRVNDALGHRMGDELLRQVVARVSESLREGDVMARLGGDEFVVVHRGRGNGAHALALRLIGEIEHPYDLEGTPAHVSASIGIAEAAADVDATELIRRADMAMYRAKQIGRGHVVEFNDWMDGWVRDRVELEEALRNALAVGTLTPHFQPIVDMDGGEVRSVELLARWIHPTIGPIPPSDFIPVAEETGLIIDIGRWALREAARAALEFRRADPTFDAQIAINISGMHLTHGDLVRDVRTVLSAHSIPPEWLRIEITETYLLDDANGEVDDVLRRLVELGVSLSIDDFGTGYSSLTYLRRVPADEVKIDRSYVAELTNDADNRAIITLVSTLAHTLDLRVVAEGVETDKQRELLAELGCDMAQGYLFSRPLPERELVNWLEARSATPV